MPYPTPDDIRRAKSTWRWFVIGTVAVSLLIIEGIFIFIIALTA